MAKTPSNMTPLGMQAPEFSLLDSITGESKSYTELKGVKGTLVMFICNHCPFVVHVKSELAKIGQDYQKQGVSVIAISSNDVVEYPQDAPDKMREFAIENDFSFPYLYDETQEIAKAFGAACTPDYYLFDSENKLSYRGQLDDARPGNPVAVDGKDLRAAIEALIEGTEISSDQKPSLGCNIKWKS